MAISHLHMPPAFQGREHHEQVGGAIAPVLIIVSNGSTGLRRYWNACFSDELLRRFVDADQGAFRIMRALINGQNIFHGGHERGIGVGRNDPLLFQMRPENVFFKVRPIVLSLARSTIFSSTTFSSSSSSVQRARPAGALEQASAISFASAAPSKIRFRAEAGECLRVRAASTPSSTSCWRVRATVSTLVSSAAAISR